MADNLEVDNGALADYTVSSDEGVGGHVQRVKLAYSADGSETHVTADANGLLVNLGTNNDVAVTGTVDLGAVDNAVLDDIAAKLATIDADTSALAGAVGGIEVQVDIVAALPAGTNAIGKLAANSGVDIGDVDVLTLPDVTLATVGSGAVTSVDDAATSTSLLASNANRKGAILFNDSTQNLYLKYGATASLTSFTYKIPPQGTWEMPQPVFTGAIDGIWAANGAGAAKITELS